MQNDTVPEPSPSEKRQDFLYNMAEPITTSSRKLKSTGDNGCTVYLKSVIYVLTNAMMWLQSIINLGLRSSIMHNFASTALFIFNGSLWMYAVLLTRG